VVATALPSAPIRKNGSRVTADGSAPAASSLHAPARMRRLDEDLGLSPARFSVLATLRYDGPHRIGALARSEGVAQPTMTQLVQALETAGLVARRPDPTDGRSHVVELTSAGRALVRRARARKIAWIDEVLADLPPSAHAAVRAAATLDRHALRP
jgi:DNA-binding MarR family transcriptional regulator